MFQEGATYLHRYKERGRDIYERGEARVCNRWINLARGWSISVCGTDRSQGCERESCVCVRETGVGRGRSKAKRCVCEREIVRESEREIV